MYLLCENVLKQKLPQMNLPYLHLNLSVIKYSVLLCCSGEHRTKNDNDLVTGSIHTYGHLLLRGCCWVCNLQFHLTCPPVRGLDGQSWLPRNAIICIWSISINELRMRGFWMDVDEKEMIRYWSNEWEEFNRYKVVASLHQGFYSQMKITRKLFDYFDCESVSML